MHTNYNNISKSIGTTAARLLLTLYEQNKLVFHLKDAQSILGESHSAPRILFGLVKKGVLSRLKPGTFRVIPFEMGFEREYLGNPFVVARELATKSIRSSKNKFSYYISHGSAFELHQMLTQPQLVVFTTTPKQIRSCFIQGTEFKFARCKQQDLFGLQSTWVDKTEKVIISDLERTLLDGLKQPKYCGGFIEVAKAFFIKRTQIDPKKIVEYATKLNIGSGIRRLGHLMETYGIGSEHDRSVLTKKLSATYHLLDPDLPADGNFYSKWKLRLNVSQEELNALGRT